jgi:2-polyprenyl-6-hydroxyphenyl methylase / 3-demethylubiquinone-9 3-methyltransferase
MASSEQVDNSIYEKYGESWYTADDDPVALLRAENKVKSPWILERLANKSKVLDVGCGAGFLTNELARHGHEVTGIDASEDSLRVARLYDETHSVEYQVADAYKLPFADQTFDVVTALDFLEHVENPAAAIAEMSRVLKPGGQFFFHTFNRHPLAWLVVIKLVEWLIPKTPKNMHVLRLFVKPSELKSYCEASGMQVNEMVGIRPVISSIPLKSLFSGRVPECLRFELTRSLLLSYMGVAKKSVPS